MKIKKMTSCLRVLIILFLSTFSMALCGQAPVGDVLIKNGTVLTITNGTLEKADVLIQEGKIVRMGEALTAPAGTKIVDATDMFVMPGIIDTHSHIAIDGINEPTSPVTAELSIIDAANPFAISLYRALAGGVTTIQMLPGSSNVIAGQGATIKLRYGVTDPRDLLMAGAPRTLKLALGENPMRIHGTMNNIVPRTRMGIEFVIREALREAQEYSKAWEEYNINIKAKGFRGKPPTYSHRLEVLADVLKGNAIIQCHSYRADEINMLLNVCKDFGIDKIVLQHANEGFKVAPEIAASGAMASVFADRWAYKFEVYYSTAYNAAILTRNGVITSINSDSQEIMRHLYHEASKTQKYGGLSEEEALALITINPATQLGIANRVGSLEVGKDGDVAIFNEHPLSIYTKPMMTIVDGIVRFDRQQDKDDMRLLVDPELVDTPVFHFMDSEEDHLVGMDAISDK